jgi:DNA-directed RNA polymerase subunit H (RpoH/RPB5)
MRCEVIQHKLVPKHELLGPEEAQQILENYKVTREQMPKILPTDPAIQHLSAKVGDLIKITRDSKFVGKSLYYRVVSE